MPKESKTANKEAKAAQVTSSYEFRDVVLAKVRGFPPWPGMVVNPEELPQDVVKEKPTGKKTKFYCIKFFPVGDHAWVLPKDISKLQRHEIESYILEPHRRSSDLLKGYKIALNPSEWEAELAAGDQEAAEAAADAEVDELDAESVDDDAPKKPSKKRKRDSVAAPIKRKEKKVKDENGEESAPKKKKATSGGVRKIGGKSKTMVESEDEGGAADDTATPAAKKAKHAEDDEEGDEASKEVKGWRHKLQKSLLVKDKKPNEDDMPELNDLFTKIEQHNMTLDQLSFSKIGKVMRHIAKLDAIPRDSEFKFRTRAQSLVDTWAKMAQAGPATNGAAPKSATKEDVKTGTTSEAKEEEAQETADMDVDAPGEPDAEAEKVNGVTDTPTIESATVAPAPEATPAEPEKTEG